jgi:5-methylcytosine-specific restriction endonuclease McrA
VAADTYSLRVTVDAAFKEDLNQLTELLSHKIPDGDLAAVLREAVRCAIDKHGRRKGAVEPARKRATSVAGRAGSGQEGEVRSEQQLRHARAAIPAEVRRQVWKRDGGQCTWRGPDGRRCTTRWKLEVDHIDPAALGGPPSVDNLRLLCRAHNTLHAEQIFGREHMARFRRGATRMGETTISGGSARGA